MTNKGLLILSAGILLLIGGLIALWMPVFIDSYDQWGFQIKCGNGFGSALTQAAIADEALHSGYVGECNSALAVKRAWAIPVTTIGALILGWVVIELWRHAAIVTADDDRQV
ncbi:hypothetical protein [Mycolicibacterium sp. XJ870]